MKKPIIIALAFLFFLETARSQTPQEIRVLVDNEQFNETSTALLALISKEPNNAVHYYYLADKLILQDREDSARIMLDIGRRIDSANSYIKIGTAKYLMDRANVIQARAASEEDPTSADLRLRYTEASENVERAKALLEQAIAVAPPKTTQIFLEAAEAMIKYTNKDLDRAKVLLERVLKMEQKNIDAHLLFGDLYGELNNGSLSAQYYNDALMINSALPRAIVSKGALYYRSTNYEGAKTEFQEAISKFPNYVPAHRYLGDTYFKLGQLELAKSEYKTYLDMSSGGCYPRNRYASFLYLTKDFQEAVNQCKQVLSMCDPTNPFPLRVMAISYYEMKDYSMAMDNIKLVFDVLTPDRRISKDYEYYGKILVALNSDASGVEQLKAAYALDPSRADLLSEIGASYLKIKNYKEAINAYRQKVDGGKEVKSADLFNLGRAYYYDYQFLDADTAFEKLTKNSPKYANGFLWRAKTNTQIDSTSEKWLARPYYEKFIELTEADPSNISKYQGGLAEAYGYLAYYHSVRMDNEKGESKNAEKALALDALKKKSALQLDPEDAKNVQLAIKQLEGK
ncbi:MAG: tetratricopeptide repeat protein [Bacteroidota bacterium]